MHGKRRKNSGSRKTEKCQFRRIKGRRNTMIDVQVFTAKNIRTVVRDSNTNGLQESAKGQNRKFKELDTF